VYDIVPVILNEAWCYDYQSIRPHSGLGRLTPDEFRVRETEFFQKQVAG
jgi:putative transposase